MKKESKICPLCNKACIIQYKNYKNIWKCTCGYEESLSNNTYVSSKGKILRNDNVFLTTKRKRTNSPKITIEDKTPPKSLNILNIEPISTIHLHTNIINSLLLLNDHTIASCSNDQTISIFDPFNPSHSSTITNRHTNNIYSLCQLSDDTIVSCSL